MFVTSAVSEKGHKPKDFMKGIMDPSSRPGTAGAKIPDSNFKFTLFCLDRKNGSILWQEAVADKKPAIPTHPSNTFATETACTDGERVYVRFGAIGSVAAFDFAGKKVWEKDLGAFPIANGFGTGSSPVLADGKLVIQCDNEEKSFAVALDAKTGDERWRVERKDKSSWATPLVRQTKERTQIVCCGSKVTAYDAKDGSVVWTLSGIDSAFAPSATADDERVYFGNSSPFAAGALYAVKADAQGDITPKKGEATNDGLAWLKAKSGPGMCSPVVAGGYLYVLKTELICLDAKTGDEKYRERLPKAKQTAASLWATADRVFVLDESGRTFVIEVGPTFKMDEPNKLDETFWATPAVAGGDLFLPESTNFIAFGSDRLDRRAGCEFQSPKCDPSTRSPKPSIRQVNPASGPVLSPNDLTGVPIRSSIGTYRLHSGVFLAAATCRPGVSEPPARPPSRIGRLFGSCRLPSDMLDRMRIMQLSSSVPSRLLDGLQLADQVGELRDVPAVDRCTARSCPSCSRGATGRGARP